MTTQPILLEELIKTRVQLIDDLRNQLTDNEKYFLISMKMGDPNWELLPFNHLKELPALRWKLLNIQRMEHKKRKEMLQKLREVLEV